MNTTETDEIVEKLPIVSKAYEIILDKLEEGYLSDTIMCYATSVNEAKKILLKQVIYDNWKLKYIGEELSYLNIPIRRRPSSDKVIFEDKEVVKSEIDRIKSQRRRLAKLEEILNDPNIQFCYIRKGGYYYGPNSCGYTEREFDAGVYLKEDAFSHATSCNELTLIPIDVVEHNKMINQKIAQLSNKLI